MKRYGARLLLLILFQFIFIITQARDFYWIGGSGNFNDIQHWSDQPGGKVNPDAQLPDKDDNVFFDQYSFPSPNANVVITNVARCANMYWGDVKNMPTLKTDDISDHYLVIYGGVTFNDKMIIDLDRPLYFRANTLGNIIDFGGNVFNGDFYFENNGGWRITSPLNLFDHDIYFNQGTLSIEANVSCGRILSENAVSRELYLNSSEITLQESGASVLYIQTENLNLYPGDSKIIISSNDSKIETFGTKRIEFYDVEFSGTSGTIETNAALASFNTVIFVQDGNLKGENDFQGLHFSEGHNYFIFSGGVQNVHGLFEAKGQCFAYINISGESMGGTIAADAVDLDYLKVQNIKADGAAIDFTANNSYDLGGNINWNFIPPAADDYTWTGAEDNNWGNPNNWNPNCVPSRINNVIIPGTSTVVIDVEAECKDLTISDNSSLSGSENLNIFGSLKAGDATWNLTGTTSFLGDASNTILINSTLPGSVIVDGNGTWTLSANCSIDNILELVSGNLISGGFDLSTGQFVSNSDFNRTLNINGSDVTITDGVSKAWDVEGSRFILLFANAKILFTTSGAELYTNVSDGVDYGSVQFNPIDSQVFLTNEGSSDPTFVDLTFNGNAKVIGNHQYEKLSFNQGKEYLFQAGSEQKILNKDGLNAMGTCSKYISFKGDGGIAYFDCDETSDFIQRVRIEDVSVKGGLIDNGNELVASQSIGVSGFTGWTFPNDLIGTVVKWTGAKDDDWFTADNWSTGCIPTRVDTVIFDEVNVINSKSVNISQKGKVAECKNMSWSNAALMEFSGDQPILIFGSLDLSGLTADHYYFSGDISFKSELAETVNTGLVKLQGDLNFEGNEQEDGTWKALSWTLKSDLNTDGSVFLRYGSLITENHDVKANTLFSNYAADHIRSLDLGTSTVQLEKMEISAEAFTLNAGASTIEFSNGGNLIISAGTESLIFNDVSFKDADGSAYLDVTADNVSFNDMVFQGNTFFRKPNNSKISFTANSIQMAVGKTYVFESGQTFILGNIIANGACEGTIDITGSRSDAAIFQAKGGVSNITVNSVNLLNINAEPTGVFVAKSSIDLGNTTGWDFQDESAGTDLFWVGGTGNWDDPNHWSTSSGDNPDGCVPTAKDNVFFDDGSFTDTEQTVFTGASDIRCKTMDWTGSEPARPNFEMGATDISGVYIYGSLIFNSEVSIDLSPMVNFYFRGTGNYQINTFGYIFPNIVEFDGKDGVWNLLDDVQIEGDCFIRYGKLITDGNNLECKSITSKGDNPRSLDIENSNVFINGKEDKSGRSVYFNLSNVYGDQVFELLSDNSTIKFTVDAELVILRSNISSISFNSLVFEKNGVLSGGSQSGTPPYYSSVKFGGNGEIIGRNQFGTLELARGFEYKLEEGRSYDMDYLLAEGSCFAPIYLHSDSDGDQTTVVAANNVTGQFLQLKDIKGDTSKGANYTATNSFDLGNVDGWITDGAIAPIALYWVGKGADDNWGNHENWSRSEDGSEEGCVPTLNDDVYFTQYSFLGSKLVEITADAQCHNIIWNDDIDPAANFKVNAKLQIGGSMDLSDNMSIDMQGKFEFIGDGKLDTKTVDFAAKTMNGDVVFQGAGQTWNWVSELITSGDLYIENGAVSTQGHDFTIGRFSSLSLDDFDAVRKFDMSGSLVTVTSDAITGWNMKMNTAGGLDFTATDSKITFPNGGGIFCATDTDVTFGFVDFYNNGVININGNGQGFFGSTRFLQKGEIFGDNTFTNLEFTLGYENNTIQGGKTITVINDLKMEGVRCSYIFLKSDTPGLIARIYKPAGTFKHIYNASFTDIQGSTGSGVDHPVHYKCEKINSSGFVEVTDPSGEDNPPSFEESFDQPREEWCSNVAVLDHVKRFPINSATTFQWYFSPDGTAGTYAELSGETNAVIEVSESGFYKVEVNYGLDNVAADGTVCQIVSVIEVSLRTISTVSLEITANNVKCFGQGDGRIVAGIANIQYPDYSFIWKDEAGSDVVSSTNTSTWESTALHLAPGKYSINVTDSKGCEFDTIVNVFDAYKLQIDDIATKDLTCYTVPTGEINIDASGGTGNLSYYLNDNLQTASNITGLFSGDYTVYVADENDCKTNEEAVLLNSNPKMEVNLNPKDLLCYQDNNGEFTPIVSGGVPDYQYAWTGPNGFTSSDINISGLPGGDYQLKLTDAANCLADTTHKLIEPEELTTNELVVEPTNCNGENSGEIFVEAKQGTPDYKYFLDDVESTDGIFSDLAPKNYTVKITDANNCVFNKEVEVTQPGKMGFLVDDIVFPTCEKTNDGIIRVSPYGGNSGYSFSWSGPDDYRSYSQNIENIQSGKYSLLITDKKNCSAVDTVALDLGLPLQLGLVVEQNVSVNGGNDGMLSIETIDGTAPYTFTVTGPGFTKNSPDNFDDHTYLIDNLVGGVYKVVATDASGCTTVEKSIIIEEPNALYAYIDQVKPVGCVGSSDGELKAITSDASGTYTYSWNGPSGYTGTGQTVSGLASGTYTVTVSGAGKTATASYDLMPADPILVSVTNYKDVTCSQAANGEIEISVDAGNADYQIEWTNGAGFLSSAKHILDLAPGTYFYKVITTPGCSVSGNQLISEPSELVLTVNPTDITDVGKRDGTVSASVTGGTKPYTIMVAGPNGYSYADVGNTSGNISINGLEMGIYEVSAIDANGCRIEESKKIHEPQKLLLYVNSSKNVTCPGGTDGEISIGVEGYSAPENVTYSWAGPHYFKSTDKDISDLSAGKYTLTIYDSAGDPGYEEQSIIVMVSEPEPLEVEYWKKDISCPGLTDGYINIHPKGGTPGYACLWTGSVASNTDEDQQNLAKGSYSVVITDQNSCVSKPVTIDIVEPQALTASVSDFKDPTCYGFENGWIHLDIANGTQPYSVNWDNYGSVTQNIEELEKGTYHYIVTDGNGCDYSGEKILNEPDSLIAQVNDATDVLCYGDGSGRALVDIQGGTPDYSVTWSDGQDSPEATDLKLGKYDVTVIDAQGCKDTSSVEIFEPEPLAMQVEVIRPTTYDSKDGSINVNITGGVLDYNIDWTDQDLNPYEGDKIDDLERGTYNLAITDKNNCPLDSTIVLEYLFERRIRIPKAFTPNNDGYNDYWDIDRIEFVQNLKIVIYDRWGKAVFKFSGTGNEYKGAPWRGADGNMKLPIGSYYYAVEVDEEKPMLGTVTILR
ncbi:gliding motility-associated C-terminal domain-containing protein [Ancylomarina longa]|uniref:T9SS C-terminal target domain-containing protein n=1 Tax=Ancylomarina longa TaxID=2487017 RepID=A0A434AGP5_9BACT|nr:gliding motility-associated C-terminal domain-containing protein [Ancylomarina longa]RUT73563.1 hypothetical protein DLK05_12720 [Ancylomarina longa]